MSGPGWIWLVDGAVVATYRPGTMLVRSQQHWHPSGINEMDLLRDFFVLGVFVLGGKEVLPAKGRAQVPNIRSGVWTHHRPVTLLA